VDGTEVLQETGRVSRKAEDGKLQVIFKKPRVEEDIVT
jgi:hypothetical protein